MAIFALTLGDCWGGASEAQLLGKWTNRHLVAKQPAIVTIEFLPKNTVVITAIDTLAGAHWHTATTSTGEYRVIASNTLKITEELGSAVLDYHLAGTRLVLWGDGLAQVLGTAAAPQTLDKAGAIR